MALKQAIFVSWMPTVGGILVAVGAVLETQADGDTVKLVGACICAAGAVILGVTARQSNITSAQSGARSPNVSIPLRPPPNYPNPK